MPFACGGGIVIPIKKAVLELVRHFLAGEMGGGGGQLRESWFRVSNRLLQRTAKAERKGADPRPQKNDPARKPVPCRGAMPLPFNLFFHCKLLCAPLNQNEPKG